MARNRLHAVSTETGEPVEVNDNVVSFRGTRGVLVSVDRPEGPGYEGKVTVRVAIDQVPQQWYASVWGLRVPPEQADAPSNTRRCEANARRGTGTGTCDRPLDVHGQCDRASNHL